MDEDGVLTVERKLAEEAEQNVATGTGCFDPDPDRVAIKVWTPRTFIWTKFANQAVE